MGRDCIGERFGMLVVQSEAEPVIDARGHRIPRYNCLCDCGNTTVVRNTALFNQVTRSCGCTRFPRPPRIDLTGRQFGLLTVLSEAEPHLRKNGESIRRWKCRCECGNETTVLHSNLIAPTGTRSCGCLRRPRTAKPKTLTGNRYGWLTVIGDADPIIRKNGQNKRACLCRCVCGRETVVSADNLLGGHTRSCGCMKARSLRGRKVGRLTVLNKVQTHTTMRYWNCRCECGNEIVVSQDDIFWGSVSSCGCDRDRRRRDDLTGQVFGRLTVLREAEPIMRSDGKHIRTWLCRCDCGREVVIRQHNLTNKVTRSCGCLRKERKKQVFDCAKTAD